jgi:hypothetical protein
MQTNPKQSSIHSTLEQEQHEWSMGVSLVAPRSLTPDEVRTVAGGPKIVNDGLLAPVPIAPKQ